MHMPTCKGLRLGPEILQKSAQNECCAHPGNTYHKQSPYNKHSLFSFWNVKVLPRLSYKALINASLQRTRSWKYSRCWSLGKGGSSPEREKQMLPFPSWFASRTSSYFCWLQWQQVAGPCSDSSFNGFVLHLPLLRLGQQLAGLVFRNLPRFHRQRGAGLYPSPCLGSVAGPGGQAPLRTHITPASTPTNK